MSEKPKTTNPCLEEQHVWKEHLYLQTHCVHCGVVKPRESKTTKVSVSIGPQSFNAVGDRYFVDGCLNEWVKAVEKLYEPKPRKMIDGDLYE